MRKTVTFFVMYMYLSPLTSKIYLLVNLLSKFICYLYSSVDCLIIFGRDEEKDQVPGIFLEGALC